MQATKARGEKGMSEIKNTLVETLENYFSKSISRGTN